jgi:hypothetical protein
VHVADRDLTPAERAELDSAMAVVSRLPRDSVDRVVRHLLRVAIYFRRTKDTDVLQSAVESLFTMVRRANDETYQKHLHEALSRKDDGASVDAETALAALRR